MFFFLRAATSQAEDASTAPAGAQEADGCRQVIWGRALRSAEISFSWFFHANSPRSTGQAWNGKGMLEQNIQKSDGFTGHHWSIFCPMIPMCKGMILLGTGGSTIRSSASEVVAQQHAPSSETPRQAGRTRGDQEGPTAAPNDEVEVLLTFIWLVVTGTYINI